MGGEYGEWCIGLAELRFQYLIDENTCRDATVVYTNGYCEITERNPAGDSQLESVRRLLLSRIESISGYRHEDGGSCVHSSYEVALIYLSHQSSHSD